jgi:hypothetical protein
MKTEIDNNLRVYLVVTSTGKSAFCNIENLNQVVKELGCNEGYFKIFHFWNNKQERVSKKDLLSFFEGSQLKQEFFY